MNLNEHPTSPKHAEPGKPKKKRHIWIYVALVLVFLTAAALGAFFASSSLLDKHAEEPVEEGLATAHDKSTIMIMGVDERDDDVGRSDTLMVATIDPKTDQAALLSVPRDTRVKIKGHGWDKINAAYAYGGERLSQRTVEDFLGINIDHYIIINTKSFQKIIDAIGGIDIDVEKRMRYEDPYDDDGGLVINLQPGLQHMDGKTAVTYVRYRDEEGDIGRIKRQQKFMQACMDKLVSPTIILKLPMVIKEVMDSLRTDLSFRQLLEFAGTLKESKRNGLKTDMVPGTPLYIDGISYWIPNMKELRKTIADTLGITFTASNKSSLDRTESEYKNSIPANAKAVPPSDHSIGKAGSYRRTKDESRSEPRRSSSSKSRSSTAGDSDDTQDTKTGSDSTAKTDTAAPSQDATPQKESAPAPAADTGAPTQSGTGGKTR